ncbi:NADH:flavin oxidoreductase/NADH oxidase [Nesterenkonia populi]|uniref:NADH:flavin oxidoreductase/NADH oxidase n=1 Tax=Nesterenkonia populi TaxID=1591087 RepID=UPI0011BF82AC|nr:NADH:flavin oxidoreductase/NADH oxidase [Nesterenkonia populi]
MNPKIFSPITLRGIEVSNRVWLSPMCMYACPDEDGAVGDFHLAHYGAVALGGSGMLITEATAVRPEGRVTPQDAGLWAAEQMFAWKRVTDFVHAAGSRIAVQLAHAGRKGSKYRNLPGDAPDRGSVAAEQGGWKTKGATRQAFGYLSAPEILSEEEVWEIIRSFADAAERAEKAGFDAVELHGAHGYLLHEFLSPLTNQRDDQWGGSPEARESFLLKTVRAVREVLSPETPLLVRLSVSDVTDGGMTAEASATLAERLAEQGADFIDCSSGGLLPNVDYKAYPGYQVADARTVRSSGVPVGAVGLITEPEQAAEIVEDGSADVVLLGRAMLRDPHWPRRAANALGATQAVPPPPQYHRAW